MLSPGETEACLGCVPDQVLASPRQPVLTRLKGPTEKGPG